MHELQPTDQPAPLTEFRLERSGVGGLVFGIAVASGRVILAERGWRAEFAEVVALYSAAHTRHRSLTLAGGRYGVPVVDDLDALVGEWAPDATAFELMRRSAGSDR